METICKGNCQTCTCYGPCACICCCHPRVSTCELVGGTWAVLIDGIQTGPNRDKSGAGDLEFATQREAMEWASVNAS